MNLRIIDTERTVLVVFAHPDDDALSCLGTLARLCDEHYQVYVLVLTAGECSITNCCVRLMEAEEVAQLVGYTLLKENLPDGNLHYDREIVSLIERHIHRLSPQMVITHDPQELGQGHQDHVVTASAVVNAARRNRCVDWILYAEPPTQNWIFVPNLFIDITEYLDIKKNAIRLHRSERMKPYMHPEIAEIRARWWATQAYTDEGSYQRFCEPFVIVRGLFRPSRLTECQHRLPDGRVLES